MAYVKRNTQWHECAECGYCGAPQGEPCIDKRKRFPQPAAFPHHTRKLIPTNLDQETVMAEIPLTLTYTERLVKLEIEHNTDRMQLRAALHAIDVLAANNEYLTRTFQQHKDTVDSLFKEQLLHKAVQLVMAFEDEPDEPTFEDWWELDQSKTDLELLYRVEEVIL